MAGKIFFDVVVSEKHPVYFGLTRRVVEEQAREFGLGKAWFRQLTKIKRYYVSKERSGAYLFYYQEYILKCVLSKWESRTATCQCFIVTSLNKADYNHLGRGKLFCFKGNVYLNYRSRGTVWTFQNGEEHDISQIRIDCQPTAEAINKGFQNLHHDSERRYNPTPELNGYLDLAQEYASASLQHEQLEAVDTNLLQYSSICGTMHEHVAGTTMRFLLDSLEEDLYNVNETVELDDHDGRPCRATIAALAPHETPPYIDLQFTRQTGLERLPQSGVIRRSTSDVNYTVQMEAIESLRQGKASATYMDQAIGRATPQRYSTTHLPQDLENLKAQLQGKKYPPNPSQETAIINGILSKDIYLVMGPPGTGKTTVILEWVRYFVLEKHMRVLVSSQNNMAVDNVLERLMREDGLEVLRIGLEDKVSESVHPCLFENKLCLIRERINDTTASNIESLRDIVDHWEQIVLPEATERSCKFFENSDCSMKESLQLIDKIKANNGVIFESLDMEVGQGIIQRILELLDKEKKYHAGHRFRQIIFTPFSIIRRKKIRKETELLAQHKNQIIEKAGRLLEALEAWRRIAVETENHTVKNILFESTNLVGATCIGVRSQKRFSRLTFDVTIIDEAGQIQIHNALVPMSLSNKLIMLGDHKQIPPMVEDGVLDRLRERGISTELMEKSLFEVLYERTPESNKSMLDTQFRMPAEIASILSSWFYNGEYVSHSSKTNIRGEVEFLSREPFVIIDTSNESDRHERSDGQGGHYNNLEAKIIAEIVAQLYISGCETARIGAIAALKAQVRQIVVALISHGIPEDEANKMVATLDSYQGQERDIILYSFVRSSRRDTNRTGVGFLTELRRLNVAMSRCKRTMIMVGDMDFLSTRNAIVDFRGEEIDLNRNYHRTERNFAQFIKHMLDCVNQGAGERISVQEYRRRLDQVTNEN